MVTHKVLGDALSVLAHELVAAARVVEHWDIKTYVGSEWGKYMLHWCSMDLRLSLWNVFRPQPALTTASFDALVSPVRTVFVSITLPTLRDTHMWSRTLERLWTAGFGLCKRLLKMIIMPFFTLSTCEYSVNIGRIYNNKRDCLKLINSLQTSLCVSPYCCKIDAMHTD